MSEIGITCEKAAQSMELFKVAMKNAIEEYLTESEVKEINNPKTKKKRIRQLIEISNQRMMLKRR